VVLLALGLDEFSMTSGQIPVVKSVIRSHLAPRRRELLEQGDAVLDR
jgi:phosphoenolpyruvate-protein kinase (PTS system EI component)